MLQTALAPHLHMICSSRRIPMPSCACAAHSTYHRSLHALLCLGGDYAHIFLFVFSFSGPSPSLPAFWRNSLASTATSSGRNIGTFNYVSNLSTSVPNPFFQILLFRCARERRASARGARAQTSYTKLMLPTFHVTVGNGSAETCPVPFGPPCKKM